MDRMFRVVVVVVGALMLAACSGTGLKPAQASKPGTEEPSSGTAVASATASVDEIADVVPVGARILATSRGDINADGRPDVVVALDPVPGNELEARSLLLLLRDGDGQLRLAARNDRIVPCMKCGGSLGEPSIHLDSGPGFFTLQTSGGTGWLWSNEYVFRHEIHDRWTLESITEEAQHRVSHEATTSKLTARDFGQVDFSGFDPQTIGNKSSHEE